MDFRSVGTVEDNTPVADVVAEGLNQQVAVVGNNSGGLLLLIEVDLKGSCFGLRGSNRVSNRFRFLNVR